MAGIGQRRIAVEHAASHGAVVIRQARREGAARDRSAGVVIHCCTEGAVCNFCTRLNVNRALHSRSGPRSCTGVLGMGGTEIIRSILQNQYAATVVLPAVALAGGFTAVGSLRVAVLHDEVAVVDLLVQHHILVRHGEFHGLLVVCIGVAAVVVRADGLAVQAENLGVGSDGHSGACADVGVPLRRHIVDFLDLGFGGGCIPSDVVATCYVD